MNENNREAALDMIAAAMSVIVQTHDIQLSAEILADAGDKYGRSLIEDLLLELTASDLTLDNSSIAKDVLLKRAMLSMTRSLPLTWMHTRN
tara:strand:- start:164 stop:436 length:273 start_codon:yes stop_codon:yes gene_type:complete